MNIAVQNLNKKFRLNEKFIKRLAIYLLKYIKKSAVSAGLEIIFLSDAAMRPLNRRFRHTDAYTDVLSFNLNGLGEVIISSDTALKNARLFGTSFEEEIVLYVIHGMLHLAGYEDGSPAQRRRMSKRENAILKSLCKRKSLSKVLMPR